MSTPPVEPEDVFHHRLARMIREYWREHGHSVSTTVEPVPGKQGRWQVRSDTLNGLPHALALKGVMR